MLTMEHATKMAEMAVDILFSDGDPFNGTVDKDSLEQEIKLATLKRLVTVDDDLLSEEEFQSCILAAQLN